MEDLHVHLALFGYLCSVARRGGADTSLLEKLAAQIVVARALSEEEPLAAGTHLALAGVITATRELMPSFEPCFSRLSPAERSRWDRDRPLLAVAEIARTARRDAAWRTVGRPAGAEDPGN